MSLLLDENLSPRLVQQLADLYPNCVHVHQVGLGTADDAEVWRYAKAYGLAIVTKDADFAERSVLDPGPPKVLWLRLGNCRTAEVERVLRSQVALIRRFCDADPETCLVLGPGLFMSLP